MINANELRVGNWVVEVGFPKNNSRHFSKVEKIDLYDEDPPTYEPVLLTPEIIENFGFKYDGKYFNKSIYFLIKNGESFDFGEWYQGGYVKIKNLHHLQNLWFALTNEELMIDEQELKRSVATEAE